MSTSEPLPPSHPPTVEEPAIDFLEELTIDGPEPMTREEFSRDSKSDANTVDGLLNRQVRKEPSASANPRW